MIDYSLTHHSDARRFWAIDQVTGGTIPSHLDVSDLRRLITPDAQQARIRAVVKTSMRAFRRSLHDACRARLCRRQAKRAASPWHRARLLQTAMQCEARVRYAADMALRGAR